MLLLHSRNLIGREVTVTFGARERIWKNEKKKSNNPPCILNFLSPLETKLDFCTSLVMSVLSLSMSISKFQTLNTLS